jgi:5'-nucleotidase|tara:strand:- start:162 stop:1073 length:912 start_codon:yes stop_codon:yes gene_type:complete
VAAIPETDSHPLTVAISSRALFDLDHSNEIYEQQGLDAYRKFQIENEDSGLEPGEGFDFVKKLLDINRVLERRRVEVILLSRNSADTGLRIFNAVKAHDLDITRAAFCGGASPYRYITSFGCDLFLSTDAEDVRHALDHGIAAATLIGASSRGVSVSRELRLAFDGDSVIFSDEAERVYQREGLDVFAESEAASADEPLDGGPFKSFLQSLHDLQQEFELGACPIRTALVTARSAPAHERVIRTLRAWDIRLDECLFLGGMEKTEFLRAFEADVFFDDQAQHCERASTHVATGHVPHGVVNET